LSKSRSQEQAPDTEIKESACFIQGLEQGNLDLIRAVPKGDLHNHSWMGGRLSYVEARLGARIAPPPQAFPHFADLLHWILRVFLPHVYEAPKREIAIEAAFVQAAGDGVTVLALSFGALLERIYDGNVHRQVAAFRQLHTRYAPQIELRPVLGLNRASDPGELMRLLELYLESGFYTAVDLYGDEFARPIRELKPVFHRAKEAGLRLMAHVGEYGDADSVLEAVCELELDEVQHGIAAAADAAVMRFLADHGIPLNVCPTSNVRLGRAESYARHPIRTLYDHGVRVTVNTDDLIAFDQGVSDEFLNLYRGGAFTAEELDDIRRNSLDQGGQ
jgi:cytosine/adenosine deaminase-related metal-dependent hydrolase